MISALKRFLSSAIALLITVNLFGCGYSRAPDEETVGSDMEKVLFQLLNSINNGDKEVFETFFDDEILADSDFNNGRDYVFNVYKGEPLSVTCKFPLAAGTHFVPGERIHYSKGTFYIQTSENEYVLYVAFYTQYRSKYPDTPYKIRKFKLLEKQALDSGENFHDCSLRYGVYYPGWVDGITY